MEKEKDFEEHGLSINDILFLVKRNIILILVITVCFTIVGAIYGYTVKAPTYSATATAVVMLDRSDSSTQGPNTSDFVYATYYTSTFSTFIQSNPVINKAVDKLDKDEGIKISRGVLAGSIRVSTQEDSLIITVTSTVADKDPKSGKEKAIKIANAVLDTAKLEADLVNNGEPVYAVFYNNLIIMEHANDFTVSQSSSGLTLTIVFMLLGAALSFGIILIKYLLDDTYTSQESFEKTYGINVLSVIPEILEANEGGKK